MSSKCKPKKVNEKLRDHSLLTHPRLVWGGTEAVVHNTSLSWKSLSASYWSEDARRSSHFHFQVSRKAPSRKATLICENTSRLVSPASRYISYLLLCSVGAFARSPRDSRSAVTKTQENQDGLEFDGIHQLFRQFPEQTHKRRKGNGLKTIL